MGLPRRVTTRLTVPYLLGVRTAERLVVQVGVFHHDGLEVSVQGRDRLERFSTGPARLPSLIFVLIKDTKLFSRSLRLPAPISSSNSAI